MMWKEFEDIAGYEVSLEDYEKLIEPMYMAVGDAVTKQEFVKMIDKKRFAIPTAKELLSEVRKEARHLYDICGLKTDWKSRERMVRAAKKYAKRKYGLDWSNDIDVYVIFIDGYEYPELRRGCTYPETMVIGRGEYEYARVKLQKTNA